MCVFVTFQCRPVLQPRQGNSNQGLAADINSNLKPISLKPINNAQYLYSVQIPTQTNQPVLDLQTQDPTYCPLQQLKKQQGARRPPSIKGSHRQPPAAMDPGMYYNYAQHANHGDNEAVQEKDWAISAEVCDWAFPLEEEISLTTLPQVDPPPVTAFFFEEPCGPLGAAACRGNGNVPDLDVTTFNNPHYDGIINSADGNVAWVGNGFRDEIPAGGGPKEKIKRSRMSKILKLFCASA